MRVPLRTRTPPPPARASRPPSAPLSHFSSAKRKSKFFAIRRSARPFVRRPWRPIYPCTPLLPPAFRSFSSRLKMSTEQNLNFLLLRPQNEEPPSNCHRRLRSLSLSLPLCFVGSIVRVSPPPPPPLRPSVKRRRRAAVVATATAFLTVPSIFTCFGGFYIVRRVGAAPSGPASPSIPPAFNICITKGASRFLGI